MSLPRFTESMHPQISDWKWFPVFVAAGLICGIIYILVSKGMQIIARPLSEKRILSCIIAGAALGLMGIWNGYFLFSGEAQMQTIMAHWEEMGAAALIMVAAGKILAVNMCLAFGWRGGNIFPVIFSAVTAGYAAVTITGAMPVFGVAVVASATCGYIRRKPLTVVAVLFLCFPVRLVIPLVLAAYIAALVPAPWMRKEEKKKKVK